MIVPKELVLLNRIISNPFIGCLFLYTKPYIYTKLNVA